MLIGRRAEIAEIRAALEENTRTMTGAVLELLGDPGMGKSSLLALAVEEAGEHGVPTLTGRATDATPFGAFVEAMDDHVTEARDWRDGLAGGEVAALAEVFPGLAAFRGDRVERHLVHRAVRGLLERLGRRRGLVLALDDVHRADSALVELLAYLCRRPPRARVLLVLAYRPRQVDPRLAAAVALGTTAVRRVELEPLTEEQSRELLGPDTPRVRAAALHRTSGGNPFYLRALAAGELPAGTRLRAVLLTELAGLSRTGQEVARTAAVIGDPFDADLVAEVAGIDHVEVTRELDEAHRRDLIRPHGLSRFTYRHDLVRQAVYASSGASWRRDVHARAGRVLRRRGEALSVCADHVARSAVVGDLDAVALLGAAAGELRGRAPGIAAGMLAEAVRLLPADLENSARHCELELQLARCTTADGRPHDARTVVHRLLHRLPPHHERRPEVVALTAAVERMLGHHTRARALLRRELRSVQDPVTAAGLQLELGMVAILSGDFSADRALIENAHRTAHRVDDPSMQAHAAALLALADFTSGAITSAGVGADAAATLVDALPDDTLATNLETMVHLGWTEMFLERFHVARDHLERGLRLARDTGQEHLLPYLLSGLACDHQWLGELDTAARWADDAVATAELTGSDELRTVTYALQALIACRQGDLELAGYAGGRAVAAAGADRDWWSATAAVIHGEALLHGGADPAECLARVVDSVGGVELSAIDPGHRPNWYQLFVYAESAAGNPAAAHAWLDRMAAAVDRLESALPCRSALMRLARGHLLLAGGKASQAVDEARAAAIVFAEADDTLDLGRARLLAGSALAASGARGDAVVELKHARRLFADGGAHRLHDEATKALRRLGHRLPSCSPRTGPPHRLTAREDQVAALIAEGLTNTQIADRLVLSVRTVDAHLRNIFTKLDVTSRAAVAAYSTASQPGDHDVPSGRHRVVSGSGGRGI
ncbi:helix-turn-helix transcriptional regulator [Saccharothrix stipae]